MSEPLTATLFVEKGKKYDENGEVIASAGRSIVFLPNDQGLQVNQKIRVKLVVVGEDKRERDIKLNLHEARRDSNKPRPTKRTSCCWNW